MSQSKNKIWIQISLTTCLIIGITGGAPFIGWEYVKPHPDLKLALLIGLVAAAGLLCWWRYRCDPESFHRLIPIRLVTDFVKQPPVISVSLIFFVYYLTQFLSVSAQHAAMETALWDFGFYDQILWNGAHGYSLMTTVRGGLHVFAEHFKPILFFLTPLYHISNSAYLLLAVTTFVSSTTLIAAYLVARKITNCHRTGLVFMLCLFFYLPFRSGINFPFHSQTFADPFLLFGFYALLHRKTLISLGLLSLALMCKESVTMEVLGLGVFLIAARQRGGFPVFILSAVFFVLIFFVIEPAFRYPYHFVSKWSFYSHFHTTDLEVWKKLLDPNPLVYLFLILGPFFFMPVFCKRWYLLLGPSLALRLLSNFAALRTTTYHYTAGLNALLMIAAIYGFVRVTAWAKDSSKVPVWGKSQKCWLLILLFTAFAFSGVPQMFSIDKNLTQASREDHQRVIRVLESIPRERSVLTSERPAAHLSRRHYFFAFNQMFPHAPLTEMSEEPDVVIVDKERLDDGSRKTLSQLLEEGYVPFFSTGFIDILGHNTQGRMLEPSLLRKWKKYEKMHPTDYRSMLRAVMAVVLIIISVFVFWCFRFSKFYPLNIK